MGIAKSRSYHQPLGSPSGFAKTLSPGGNQWFQWFQWFRQLISDCYIIVFAGTTLSEPLAAGCHRWFLTDPLPRVGGRRPLSANTLFAWCNVQLAIMPGNGIIRPQPQN
jgi:hypothetical protein